MLREVDELPPRTKYHPSIDYVEEDVLDFVESDMQVAEVVREGKTASQLFNAISAYIQRHPELCVGVKISVRGKKAYLFRQPRR